MKLTKNVRANGPAQIEGSNEAQSIFFPSTFFFFDRKIQEGQMFKYTPN